jgi:hypothetical protein
MMQLMAFAVLPMVQVCPVHERVLRSHKPPTSLQALKARPNDIVLLKRLSVVYCLLLLTMYTLACYTCLHFKLPPASGLIVMCECARFSMKMHAYAREKVVHGLRAVWADLQASEEAESLVSLC